MRAADPWRADNLRQGVDLALERLVRAALRSRGPADPSVCVPGAEVIGMVITIAASPDRLTVGLDVAPDAEISPAAVARVRAYFTEHAEVRDDEVGGPFPTLSTTISQPVPTNLSFAEAQQLSRARDRPERILPTARCRPDGQARPSGKIPAMSTTPRQRLYAAIAEGDLETARAQLDAHPDLLTQWAVDETWLHVAASLGRIDIAAMLIEAGIDINAARDGRPDTPLASAAQGGQVETARWLIAHGADVQRRGDGAPLVTAVLKGALEVVEVLVEAGAELDAVVGGPGQERSALAWAEFYGHDDIADYLRGRGAAAIGPEEEATADDEIVAHLEEWLGEVEPLSLQRIVEGTLPIAIHVVRGDDRITLVTSGMSAQPMTVPEGEEEYQYAELMIHLPKRWPLSKKVLAKQTNFWPVEWLLAIAHYPHDNGTWLGGSHAIIANGEPPEPLGPGVGFTCVLVLAQESELGQLETSDGRTIVFYTLFPLYTEERDLELDIGTVELLTRFAEHGISDIVKLGRDNVGE